MLSFQILPHGLILDPATCSAFRSCLLSSLPILPHTLLLNITTCPFGSHHMPLMLSFEVLPHILLSFISCLVIFPLSGLVTCTPLRPRDHMPYFQVWPHALLLDLALCPPVMSWPLPFLHISLHGPLQIMPHAFNQVLPHALLSDHVTSSHHHVPEGFGVFPVPWSSRWSWSLHLFLGRPMYLRTFGLYCSACFGSLFVSILCTCCSHFSW